MDRSPAAELATLARSAGRAAWGALAHPRATWTVWRQGPAMLRALDRWMTSR